MPKEFVITFEVDSLTELIAELDHTRELLWSWFAPPAPTTRQLRSIAPN